jgi:hypothetical protein
MQIKNRKVDFFEEIYNKLLHEYGSFLSDSRIENVLNKQVKIVDSSTIILFKNIMSCVGRKSKEGKSEGKFEFLTNLFKLKADVIAGLYKIRWQIELVFVKFIFLITLN